MGKAHVTGYRMDPQVIEVGGTEGKSIKQVAADLGVDMSGRVWILNGDRLSESEVHSARVKDGDKLRTGAKSDQGMVWMVVYINITTQN